MIPHSWIEKLLEIFNVAGNIMCLFDKSKKKWNKTLTAAEKDLRNFRIKRGIFQGDNLLSFLFLIALIPLSMLINVKYGYNFGNDKANVSTLLFMDDLKLYKKNALFHLFSECDKLAQQEYKLWNIKSDNGNTLRAL